MNKDIYNFTMKLSEQFHNYFCQFNKYDKLTKGKYVETKINALIIQCAHMYFDKEKFSYSRCCNYLCGHIAYFDLFG